MSYMKLIKLMYFADRAALLRWGRPISTDRYVSMDRGPVLSRVLNLASEDHGHSSVWSDSISDPSNYEVQLKADAGTDELSKAEIELLTEIFEKHGARSRWELVDLAHELPEWRNPNGGAIPIEYRDILKAEGRTDSESAAVESELDELAEMDRLLQTC